MKKPSLPERLAVALLSEIVSGHYTEDCRFLSRREIMKQWKVSSPTATKSLQLLSEWGILSPRLRSGHHFCPQFLTRAMLRMNKANYTALPGQPQWDNKARAIRHGQKPLSRIAVVSISDEADILRLNSQRFATMPNVPLSVPIEVPAKTIFTEANEADITVDFYLDNGEPSTRQQIISELLSSRIQGVIILRRLMAYSVSAMATELLKHGIPVVTAFDDCENLRMVSVNFNNVSLGYSAAQQFINKGHRHIAVSLPVAEEAPYYYRDRFHGCELAAREYNSAHPDSEPVQISPVVIPLYATEAIPKATKLFNPKKNKPATALLATAVGLFQSIEPSLRKLKMSVPEDLSVILCSSRPELLQERPIKFDIMKLDFEEIGRHTFRALQASYKGHFTEKTWLVEPRYEEHGTTLNYVKK